MLDRFRVEAYKAPSFFNLEVIHIHLTGVMNQARNNRMTVGIPVTGASAWRASGLLCVVCL